MNEIPIDGQELIFVDESDKFKEIYKLAASASTINNVVKIRRTTLSKYYDQDEEMTAEGRFGCVYRCRCLTTSKIFAAKSVYVKNEKEKKAVEQEIAILSRMDHPNIVRLIDAIDAHSVREMVLIMEMISGGELFDRIADKHFVLTETAIAMIIGQICEALRYVHKQRVIHLDVKPENILFDSKHGNRVKLIDFGLAQEYDETKDLQMIAGTAEFIAPEVINFEPLDTYTDMWSVGIITYILVSGISPFLGDTDPDTYVNVTKGRWQFDESAFEDVSIRAKDFISKLLKFNKRDRMSANDCLEHTWISWNRRRSAGPSLQKQRLIKYVIRRRWRRVYNTVLAVHRIRRCASVTRSQSTTDSDSTDSCKSAD